MVASPAVSLVQISRDLARTVDGLAFGPPVTVVYDPLLYARRPHEVYASRFGKEHHEILLVGMNPGPWGMVQTGVPFGDVVMVRDWLGIEERVEAPAGAHPNRPVLGFSCSRREVSGTRLWSWARERFDRPEAFFRRFFVWNYCPLAFLEESGRNRTPDRLPAAERAPLFRACDHALRRVVDATAPRAVIGIGGFAEARIRAALPEGDLVVGRVLHPSPASPKANRGWAEAMDEGLLALGIEVPSPGSGAR